jgi:hypothetical protein
VSSTDKVGGLHLGVAGFKDGGKLIDTWKFSSPFHRGPQAKSYEVEVYMRKKHANFDSGTIDFVAKCPGFPHGPISSSDIDMLRLEVEKVLREQDILRSGVAWEDWLEVRVHAAHVGGRNVTGQGLSIEYTPLKRGRDAESGGDYTIGINGVVANFPSPKKSGVNTFEDRAKELLAMGLDGFKGLSPDGREKDTEYAYILDTPEHRACLDQMMGSLVLLRNRLSEFLGQQNISGALEMMQQAKLLPAE